MSVVDCGMSVSRSRSHTVLTSSVDEGHPSSVEVSHTSRDRTGRPVLSLDSGPLSLKIESDKISMSRSRTKEKIIIIQLQVWFPHVTSTSFP